MKKLIIWVAIALLLSFASGGSNVIAGNPPSDYYVDETKLPFDALLAQQRIGTGAFMVAPAIASRSRPTGTVLSFFTVMATEEQAWNLQSPTQYPAVPDQ